MTPGHGELSTLTWKFAQGLSNQSKDEGAGYLISGSDVTGERPRLGTGKSEFESHLPSVLAL